MDKCACCGKEFMVRQFHEEERLYDFCLTCRDNRCDAYPGTCPNAKKFHAEVMSQIWENSNG